MDAPALIAARFAFARDIAREAGALAMSHYRRPGGLAVESKGLQDVVTVADRAVETTLVARIAKAFPCDVVLGEEGGYSAAYDGSAPLWVIDPIDGTANFARGIPHFCISIAFVRDLQTEVGVIYQPATDELYVARRGGGATLNGRPIRVSGLADPRQAMIEAGWSTRRPTAPYIALVDHLYRAGAQVRRAGSGTLGLAYVADGRTDAYCELHMNSWDVLAGLLLVEEAGGYVNDFLAEDGLRRGNAVLGCTPALKGLVAEAMHLPGR